MATPTISNREFDAVIFDLDGVITKTAAVHEIAWAEMFDRYLRERADADGSEFRPFTTADYGTYVDGKPRYDGVRSFLESRGIDLPWGDVSDPAEADTVCGLGNRKNVEFRRIVDERGVEPYPSTIAFIRALEAVGIHTALFSSSRNAVPVLESAGLGDLFEVKVDGEVAAELGLPGKPEPDVLLEATRRLGATPDRTAVVEDAISGVTAGRAGGFRLVIGLDRIGQADELAASGADVVIADLDQARVVADDGRRAVPTLPSARSDEFWDSIGDRRPAVFLDYDGTLTPIVEHPDLAVLAPDTKTSLEALATVTTVGILSGRDVADVMDKIAVPGIYYAGSHGFDIVAPDGDAVGGDLSRFDEFLPHLDATETELRARLAEVPGFNVERKRFAIAVHYRQVPEQHHGTVAEVVEQVAAEHPTLRVAGGKMIFEVRPDIEWDKGTALDWLLREMGLDGPDVLPIYIGDDRDRRGRVPFPRGPRDRHRRRSRVAHLARHVRARQHRSGPRVPRRTPGPRRREHIMKSWQLTYEGFDPDEQGLREALSTLGNGYFATRGAAAEKKADDVHYPGTYVAGLYNRLGTEMGGRVIENEDLVNVPNWLPLEFRVDEDGAEWFDIDTATVEQYVHELDIRRGVLTRSFVWVDGGRRTLVTQRRFVSMRDPHLAGISTGFRAENWSGRMVVRSSLDGTVINAGVPRYRALASEHLTPLATSNGGETMSLVVETNQSRVAVALAARTRVTNAHPIPDVERTTSESPGHVAQELTIDVDGHRTIAVEKMVTLYTSRDRGISEPTIEAREHLGHVADFEQALEEHVLAWDHLWHRFAIETAADDETRMILNLHAFHLLQTASKHSIDLDVGVPARGWHGEAYRGHVFWDELFIFPFLTLHMPDITRALLQYRYRRLPQAVLAAKAAGYEGAMFPWQSGSNGREETQVVHLNPKSGNWHPDNSHRQRHINIAVAFNVWKYFQATGDIEFMAFQGAEMMVSIARFWASIASFDKALNRYEIRGVMGPDEYHDGYPDADPPAGLDNNAYTNIMVVWVLMRTRRALDAVPEFRHRELIEKLGLRREELERWDDICDRMYVPFHGDGIISQFEGYDDLEEFDWEGYTERYGNIQRLDRILEAEGISANNYKVSKQADVLMLFYLLSDDELAEIFERLGHEWDPAIVGRNVDYYLARTSHGSTLSRVVQSFVLARSDPHQAWESFQEALGSDVHDVQGGTTAEGIHLGAMAGTVDLVRRCFAGMETREGKLWFTPSIPNELRSLRMSLQYRGGWVDCEMSAESMTITSREDAANPVLVVVNDEEFELTPGAVRTVALA